MPSYTLNCSWYYEYRSSVAHDAASHESVRMEHLRHRTATVYPNFLLSVNAHVPAGIDCCYFRAGNNRLATLRFCEFTLLFFILQNIAEDLAVAVNFAGVAVGMATVIARVGQLSGELGHFADDPGLDRRRPPDLVLRRLRSASKRLQARNRERPSGGYLARDPAERRTRSRRGSSCCYRHAQTSADQSPPHRALRPGDRRSHAIAPAP